MNGFCVIRPPFSDFVGKISIVVWGFVFLSLSSLRADPAWLASLLDLAMEKNPAVQATWSEFLARKSETKVAGTWPDPMVEVLKTERAFDYRWSQKIRYPGEAGLARAGASKRVDAERQLYHERAQAVAREVKIAFFEFFYATEARKLTQELESHLIALTPASGLGSRPATENLAFWQKLDAEGGQLRLDLINFEELAALNLTRLRLLTASPTLTPPPRLTLPRIGPLPDENFLRARFRELNPMLLADQALADEARNRFGQSHYERWPELRLMVESKKMEKRDTMLGVELSLPWNISKNRAMIDSAAELARAAKSRSQSTEIEGLARLEEGLLAAKRSFRVMELYHGTLVPRAREGLRSAESAYHAGNQNLAMVAESRLNLYNFELAGLRATTDYHQNLNRLQELFDGSLPEVSEGTK